MIFFSITPKKRRNFFPISALSSKKWSNFLSWEVINMINCFYFFDSTNFSRTEIWKFFHWFYGGIEDKKNFFWDFLTFRGLKVLRHTECLSHGTVTREFWLLDLGAWPLTQGLWRVENWRMVIFDAQNYDAGWFLTQVIFGMSIDADELWRSEFWRRWILTYFSFVHVIWRNFGGVNWRRILFACISI